MRFHFDIFISVLASLGCTLAVDPLALCSENLVTGAFRVPDDHLTASSSLQAGGNSYTAPERARLNTTAEQLKNGTYLYGGWSANANTKKEYIQVELNEFSLVRGIYTQGRNLLPTDKSTPEYLALYRVAVSSDGATWTPITDANGKEKIFRGNIDTDTIEYNELPCGQLAKYVRIYPEAWSQHVSLRFDIKGCQIDTHPQQTTLPTTPIQTTTTAATTTTSSQQTTTTVTVTSSATLPPLTTTASTSAAPLPKGPKTCISSNADCASKMGNFQSCHKCTSYITCVYGIAYLQPCPAGLEWNDVNKVCDWPNNAGCKVQP